VLLQTMSIISPEELRLPTPKAPDSMKDAASRTAFQALAALVDTCCCTAASERPTMECALRACCAPFRFIHEAFKKTPAVVVAGHVSRGAAR
jgi:hypothetical protein